MTCQRLKENDGFANGISFWYPHCIPKFLVDKAIESEIIVKRTKLMAENTLPDKFNLIPDREYVASINNVDITFEHYLLTPNENFIAAELVTASAEITKLDCKLKCGGLNADLDDFDMNSLDVAAGAEFAAQQSLKIFAEDSSNNFSDRIDSVLLYAWLGSFDGSIDELYSFKPWAAEFILKTMTKYGPTFAKNDSNLLLKYSAAYDSLTFQADKLVSAKGIPRTFSQELQVISDG
jgi:hypothetical protein